MNTLNVISYCELLSELIRTVTAVSLSVIYGGVQVGAVVRVAVSPSQWVHTWLQFVKMSVSEVEKKVEAVQKVVQQTEKKDEEPIKFAELLDWIANDLLNDRRLAIYKDKKYGVYYRYGKIQLEVYVKYQDELFHIGTEEYRHVKLGSKRKWILTLSFIDKNPCHIHIKFNNVCCLYKKDVQYFIIIVIPGILGIKFCIHSALSHIISSDTQVKLVMMQH